MLTKITIKPKGVLGKYYRDRKRVSLIMGPLGSGKTIMTCQKILKLMMEQPANEKGIRPTRWVAMRNTFPDLANTTIKDWLGLWGDLGVFTNGAPPRHMLDFDLDDGTRVQAEMLFIALDRPDDVKKLRGLQATGFWLNEVKELSRAVVDMADLRHGRYPSNAVGNVTCKWHGMLGDSNAWDSDHWLFDAVSKGKQPDGWAFYRQDGGLFRSKTGWVSNPKAENLHNLPDEYYTNGMAGKRDDWIAVNLGNEYGYVQSGRPVWPEYIDTVHCAKEPLVYDKDLTVYVGIDFGLTPAATFGQFSKTGQWRVIRELVATNMGASGFSSLLKREIAKCGRDIVITGDPAGEQRAQTDKTTPFEILYNNGINATPADTNDPVIRIEAVAAALTRMDTLGGAGFLLSPECSHLRKAMSGAYAYKRVQVIGMERYKDQPDKDMYSHVSDALQYMMIGAGEGNALIGWNNDYNPNTYNPDDYTRDVR